MHRLFHQYYQSPIGWLHIQSTDEAIVAIEFCESVTEDEVPHALTQEACTQLQAYFASKRHRFELPIQLRGTTFQQQVWRQLMQIPYGATISYLTLARLMGNAKSIRAVAHANARNPLAIIVPCHRVIGEDGSLVGYAAGIWRKQWLLEHESSARQLALHFS